MVYKKTNTLKILGILLIWFFTTTSTVSANADVVSLNLSNNLAQGDSYAPVSSDDGNMVIFESFASDLVTGDGNGFADTFIRNHTTNTTKLISLSNAGVIGNNESRGLKEGVSISGDGRWAVFASRASNLVSGDTNGLGDIFLYDTVNNTTQRVSVTSTGAEIFCDSTLPDISTDGNYITYVSGYCTGATPIALPYSLSNRSEIFRFDRLTGVVDKITQTIGNVQPTNISTKPQISANGSKVVFQSRASNLVSGDTNGSITDIFLYDTTTGTTTLISKNSSGVIGDAASTFPSMSDDGTKIVFVSEATNLVSGDTNENRDIFLYDTSTGQLSIISKSDSGVLSTPTNWGHSSVPVISKNGQRVIYSTMANNISGGAGLKLLDLSVNKTITVPFSAGGDQNFGNLSADGLIAFWSGKGTSIYPNPYSPVEYYDIYRTPVPMSLFVDVPPTVTISSTTTGPISTPIVINIVTSEDITELTTTDIVCTGCTVSLLTGTGSSYTATITPTVTSGNMTVKIPAGVSPVGVVDLASNRQVQDSNTFSINVQITPLAPAAAPDMTDVTDNGNSNTDNVTTNTNPTFTGICNNGETVKLYIDGVVIVPQQVCSGGIYTITPTSPISVGTHTIKKTYSNLYGESSYSPVLSFEIIAAPVIGGGGGGSSSSGKLSPAPINTTPTIINQQEKEILKPDICPYFTQYMKKGDRDGINGVKEVKKVQSFINQHMQMTIAVDGIYLNETTNAVMQYQQKYKEKILSPWNLTRPTGRWYQSTRNTANSHIGCPEGVLVLDNGVTLK